MTVILKNDPECGSQKSLEGKMALTRREFGSKERWIERDRGGQNHVEIQGGSSLAGVKEGVWRSRRKSSIGGHIGKCLVFLFAPRLLSQAIPLPHTPALTNCAAFGLSNAETTD